MRTLTNMLISWLNNHNVYVTAFAFSTYTIKNFVHVTFSAVCHVIIESYKVIELFGLEATLKII